MLTEAEIQTLRNNPDALNAIQLQLTDYGSTTNVVQAINNPNSPLYKALMTNLDRLFQLDALKQQNQQVQAHYNQLLRLTPTISIPIHDDRHLPKSDENKTKTQQKIADDDSLFKQLMDKLKTIQNQMNNVHQQLEAAVKEHIQTTENIANAKKELNAVAVVHNQNKNVTHEEYIVNVQLLHTAHPTLIVRDEVEKLQRNPDYIVTFQAKNAQQLQLIVQNINTRLDQLQQNQKQLENKFDKLMVEQKRLAADQKQVLQEINKRFPQQGVQLNQTPSTNNKSTKNDESAPNAENKTRNSPFRWILNFLTAKAKKAEEEEKKQNDVSRPTPRMAKVK